MALLELVDDRRHALVLLVPVVASVVPGYRYNLYSYPIPTSRFIYRILPDLAGVVLLGDRLAEVLAKLREPVGE